MSRNILAHEDSVKKTGVSKASKDRHNAFGSADDHSHVFQMIFAFAQSQIVRSAAIFSLAEHLANGPRTAAEIARAEGIDADAAFRLMRACASLGLLTYVEGLRFCATPLLRTLHKDDPHSLKGPAQSYGAPSHWLPWGHLPDAIKSGRPQTKSTLGVDIWEYFARTPEEADIFNQSMKATSLAVSREAATLIDTRSAGIAIDIGGASGTVILELLKANASLHGAVFDLPHVVPEAMKAAEELGLQERFSVVGGDFFASVPPADLYLLKWVLHDWEDDACLSILKNCRASINSKGRVILIERIIEDVGKHEAAPTSVGDLNMLVLVGGRERTLDEYKVLLDAAGFRDAGVMFTSASYALIEGVAI